MGLDLGRVQGAGWFHTSAASSTNISVSSLQPQLTPFVGDAVLFPNGDVRQIIGVNSSTVTLGNVLWSNKGDPGIGNANLLNTYGNSNQDGYTQEAANGVVQAKNYYNQAVYDSSVSNGDGTAEVERNTKFLFPNDLLLFNWFYEPNFNRWAGYAPNSSLTVDIASRNAFKNNLFPYYNFGTGTTNSIGIHESGIIYIVYSDAANVTDLKVKVISKLFIQYQSKTSYTEQVIENQPIRLANQEEEWDWHEEWRKGLNLCPLNYTSGIALSYDAGNTFSNSEYNTTAYIKVKPNTTYTASNVSVICGYNDSHSYLQKIAYNEYNDTVTTFTTGNNVTLIRMTSKGTSFMLNEGTHPYPYKPYYGKILHEIDLSGVQLFPEGVNPAQTIGGDWEDKGTVTTSDNTVFHAYRRLS